MHLLLIFLVSAICFSSDRSCPETVARQLNNNLGIEVADYGGHFKARNLSSVRDTFPDFVDTVESLPKNARILDNGGGLGVATVELLVANPGFSAIVITAHDFMSPFLAATDFEVVNFSGDVSRGGFGIAKLGLNAEDIGLIGESLGISFFAKDAPIRSAKSKEEIGAIIKPVLEAFRTRVRTLIDEGRLRYVHDLSENALSSLQGKCDLVYDLYGAQYYSPNRVLLFELTHDALKVGGIAYIHAGRVPYDVPAKAMREAGIWSYEYDYYSNGHQAVPLVEHLTSTHPDVFELIVESPHYDRDISVKLRRNGEAQLDLGLKADFSRVRQSSNKPYFSRPVNVIYSPRD